MTLGRPELLKALSALDLTDLSSQPDVPSLLSAVSAFPVPPATLCIPHSHIPTPLPNLPIATVINFPHGTGAQGDIENETKAALRAGAAEFDVVWNFEAFNQGHSDAATMPVRVVTSLVPPERVKIIMETSALADIASAVRVLVAQFPNVGFLKTSTGKHSKGGATIEAVTAMLDGMPAAMGIKISGGVRTLEDVGKFLRLVKSRRGESGWDSKRFRIGASGLGSVLKEALNGKATKSPTEY